MPKLEASCDLECERSFLNFAYQMGQFSTSKKEEISQQQ